MWNGRTNTRPDRRFFVHIFYVFFWSRIGYNRGQEVSSMSTAFVLTVLVGLTLLAAILTAGYNDDKTKGL